MTFDPEPDPLRVAYVPINYRPASGGGGLPDIATIPQWHEFMETIYPLTRVDYKVLPAINWPLQMQGAQPPGREDRRAELLLNRLSLILTRYNSTHPPQDHYDQVFGVFPGGAVSFCISDPRWASGLGLASYCYRGGSWMAHEIGHNLGLRHPNTPDACKAWDPNTDWPYTNATIQEYGWDSRTSQVIASTYTDMMSYCEPNEWISPFHYNKLIGASDGWQEPTGHFSAGQTYLIASGLVYTDGTVLFDPFWQISTTQALENPPAGSAYCLELRDASDTVLQSYCFDLDFYNDQTYEEMEADAFLLALPLDADTQRVVLQQDAVELGAVTASTYSPTVTLLSPNGGEVLSGTVTVNWTASDDDGDPLSYSLFYSPDAGTSWLPAAIEITGTNSYTLALSLLPGTDSAQLRIEASDGFHQASDTSDGTFTVEDKPPWVGISQPEESPVLSPLTLQGYAYDPEDGMLEGGALAWSSDRDGTLGTGERLEDVELSLGRHVLTLTAIDSQGHQCAVSTTVLVGSYVFLPVIGR